VEIAAGEGVRPVGVLALTPTSDEIETVTVVVHPGGSAGALAEDLSPLTREKGVIVLVEPFLARDAAAVAARHGSAYYTTYNKPVLAERVQEILTSVAYARTLGERVNLVGLGEAGPWVLLARPFAGEVRRTVADAAQWEWPVALPPTHAMALPAVRRYGGMKAFAALCAPYGLYLHNTGDALDTDWLNTANALEGGRRQRLSREPVSTAAALEWVARR
jgi:hypothetical protein